MNTALKVVLGIFILGILYFVYLFSTGNLAMPIPQEEATSTSQKLIANGENIIAMAAQKPGKEFFVNYLQVKDPSFVVIQKYSEKETAGEITTVSKLIPLGQTSGEIIMLTTETKDGEEYIATIAKDNGDGVFSPENDAPVLGNDGKEVSTLVSISKDANPEGVAF